MEEGGIEILVEYIKRKNSSAKYIFREKNTTQNTVEKWI
jgi:hypothetical protein